MEIDPSAQNSLETPEETMIDIFESWKDSPEGKALISTSLMKGIFHSSKIEGKLKGQLESLLVLCSKDCGDVKQSMYLTMVSQMILLKKYRLAFEKIKFIDKLVEIIEKTLKKYGSSLKSGKNDKKKDEFPMYFKKAMVDLLFNLTLTKKYKEDIYNNLKIMQFLKLLAMTEHQLNNEMVLSRKAWDVLYHIIHFLGVSYNAEYIVRLSRALRIEYDDLVKFVKIVLRFFLWKDFETISENDSKGAGMQIFYLLLKMGSMLPTKRFFVTLKKTVIHYGLLPIYFKYVKPILMESLKVVNSVLKVQIIATLRYFFWEIPKESVKSNMPIFLIKNMELHPEEFMEILCGVVVTEDVDNVKKEELMEKGLYDKCVKYFLNKKNEKNFIGLSYCTRCIMGLLYVDECIEKAVDINNGKEVEILLNRTFLLCKESYKIEKDLEDPIIASFYRHAFGVLLAMSSNIVTNTLLINEVRNGDFIEYYLKYVKYFPPRVQNNAFVLLRILIIQHNGVVRDKINEIKMKKKRLFGEFLKAIKVKNMKSGNSKVFVKTTGEFLECLKLEMEGKKQVTMGLKMRADEFCNFCKEELTKKKMRCSRCKKRYYCSAECQKKDWSEHKKECKKPQ